jgi:uncharacterized membrane protein
MKKGFFKVMLIISLTFIGTAVFAQSDTREVNDKLASAESKSK